MNNIYIRKELLERIKPSAEIVRKASLKRVQMAIAGAYQHTEEHKRRIALKKMLRHLQYRD